MKKSSICLCLLSMSLLVFSGCAGGEKTSMPEELPSTLTITAQLPTEYPETVTKYQAERFPVNETVVASVLMSHEPTERTEWAEGPTLVYQDDHVWEYLHFSTNIAQGSFSFRQYTNEEAYQRIYRACKELRPMRPWEYTGGLVSQTLGTLEMEDYPEKEDLSFLPYEEAKSQLEETMKACGLPTVELYFSEVHTIDGMNRNREIYNSALALPENAWMTGPDREKPFEELTQEDEHYYFTYRQVQDGIPFTSAKWPRSLSSGTTENNVAAVVSKDGLLELNVRGIFAVETALETCEIISPQEAVNVYLEEYTQAIHFENTRVTGVELNYVVVKDGDSYVARPAWMLTLETDMTIEETSDQPAFDYVEFETLAVSADTGIILERGTDTR